MLRLEIGQNLSVILSEPAERAVQVHPLFIHDDGDDVMTTVSRCLLDVVRVHVLVITVRQIYEPFVLRNTHVCEDERLCGQTENRLQRGMRHDLVWDV